MRLLRLFASAAFVVGVGVTSVTGIAHATAAEVFEIGPRGRALAGAGQSLAAGYESTFTNPAALTLARSPELSLGYSANRFSLTVMRDGQPVAVPAQGSGDVLFGFVLPLHVLDEPWVLGFASQSPASFIARAELPLPEVPQFPLLVPQSQALDFELGLGVGVTRWLRLGAGFRALASLNGSVRVTATSAGTTTHANDTLDPRFSPIFGALVQPSERDAIALSFHGPLRADFRMQLSAADLGATTLPPLNIDGVAAYDPLEIALEYRHGFGPLDVLAGVAYRRWSRFPDPLPATVTCPPQRPGCAALPAEHASFHDTLEPHLAAVATVLDRRALRAYLRAGYAYHPSPIPEQTGLTSWLDSNRHVLGAGYGVELAAPLLPLAADLGCQLHELASRSHHQGQTQIYTPRFSLLQSSGHAESCALTVGARFE